MINPNTPAPKKFQKFTAIRNRKASENPKDDPVTAEFVERPNEYPGTRTNFQTSSVSSTSGITWSVEKTLPMAIRAAGFAFQ